MNTDAEKIVLEALELPPTMRAFVAEKLLESLDAAPSETLSPEWKATIRKRCEEIDEGLTQLRDAEAVFSDASKSL